MPMRIGVRLPGVDQNRGIIGQRTKLVADVKGGVGAAEFEQDMAGAVSMRHQRAVHVEQSDTTELTLKYVQRMRHKTVYDPDNEQP